MEFVPALGEITLSLFLAFLFIVSLPLDIRRLHDIGKNTWYILIGLIPIVGQIILLVFFCKDSSKESNKWGDSPKYEEKPNNELIEAIPIENEINYYNILICEKDENTNQIETRTIQCFENFKEKSLNDFVYYSISKHI